MYIIKRSTHNPLISPNLDHPWEARATFSPSPIAIGTKTHILYRALGNPDPLQDGVSLSIIGKGVALDSRHVQDRRPFITPKESWEQFGCEDPRVTKFDGNYYIFYTALSTFPFRAEGIRVGVAVSSDLETVEARHLVTPFNAKAFALFPKRVGGKITGVLSAHTDEPPAHLAIVQCERIEELWNPEFWKQWHERILEHRLDFSRSGTDHIENGAPPIETKHGWLLLYSHIQHYFGGGERVFGVEAALLDKNDPKRVIGRTRGPMLVPEETYERFGMVSNIVFPTGALLQKNGRLDLYYSAADTVCARASLNVNDLLAALLPERRLTLVRRTQRNPIIQPIKTHPWEAKATFNAGAVDLGGSVRLLYRAMGHDNTSVLGYAELKNGLSVSKRLDAPVYVPREEFEQKLGSPNGNSGCEDPRIVEIGQKLYITYTAYDGRGPARVALSSIGTKDFLEHKFERFSKPILISPPGVDDKDTCILPKKINGEYILYHRIGKMICADFLPNLSFSAGHVDRCIEIIGPRAGMWDSVKIGINGVPIETDAGWLMLYHGVSSHSKYRFGAVLLDKKTATSVIARTVDPIFEPTTEYEKSGQVNHVVFSNGSVRRGDTLYLYYGGGDSVLCVATASIKAILKMLLPKNLE